MKRYYPGAYYREPIKQRIYNSKGKGHVRPRHSFVSRVSGNRINCTSKYMPHEAYKRCAISERNLGEI